MLEAFQAVLQPMLMLFLCIAIGFVLTKKQIIPTSAASILAKLETWVFVPALNFSTMCRFCNIASLSTNIVNLIFGFLSALIALAITYSIVRLFVREKCYEQNIYKYGLTFGNFGYASEPLVQAMYGDSVLSYYKIYTMPLTILVFTWGMSILVPRNGQKHNPLKSLCNPPTISILLGVVAGFLGLGGENGFLTLHLPFAMKTLDLLKACMGPVAMLLAGITIAKFDFVSMFKEKKVYAATILRLIAIPVVLIGLLYGVQQLCIHAFSFTIPNSVLYLAFFAFAAPLGMNTIVYPEAYGGDAKIGASMAIISDIICIATIPLLFSLMTLLLGAPIW